MSTARILIIDGQGDCTLTAARTLMPEGYSVQATSCPQKAEELMASERPDLILADCMIESRPMVWVEKASELGLTAQVIAVTEEPDFEKAMAWTASGLFSVLARPLDDRIFRQRSLEALESCRTFKELLASPEPGLSRALADFYYGLAGRIDGPELKSYLIESIKKLTGATGVELCLIDEPAASPYQLDNRALVDPQISNQPAGYDNQDRGPADFNRRQGYELASRGRHLGELYLHFGPHDRLRPGHRKIMLEILSASASALDSSSRYQRAVSLASRDPLTNLYNRRVFEEGLKKEFTKAKRHDFNLTLICLDLDNFKKANDDYGHQFGDLAVYAVGGLLSDMARGGDLPARLGGEEFAILLPHTTEEQALILGERIRTLLSGGKFDFYPPQFHQTISQGVAGLEHFMVKSPEDMIYWANQALYLAKREGRDTIRTASDLPMTPVMKDGAYAFQ